MKNKKILVIIIIAIIMLISATSIVNAANYSFTFTVNPEQINANLGDTITVELGIADIDQSTDGINAIQGDLSYDDNLFESVQIVATGSNWSAKLNESSDSNLKGRFVINNMNSVKSSGVVATLTAKIKSNAQVTSGTIHLNNVFSSYGTTETDKTNKTITVNITSQQNSGSGSSSNGSSTPTKTNSSPKTSNNNPNVATVSNLPKTGLTPWIGMGIVIAMIGAIVYYICYKKID